MQLLIELAERRLLPDDAIRYGIRNLLAARLKAEGSLTQEDALPYAERLACEQRATEPVIGASEANEQHYEAPVEFFQSVLGPRLKYSSGYWPTGKEDLAASEEAMLSLTCERTGLEDGMRVLELGCGWGSLTLWMAEQYPGASITAMSNSTSQRAFIERLAEERGLTNLRVVTANIADFEPENRFDRVVSVEMFEHVRNHEWLFSRIADWLADDGRLFAHVFCHRVLAYTFEDQGPRDWMTRHFFTGGVMPSERLFEQYDRDLRVIDRWWVPGGHYARTCEAWLAELDRNHARCLAALAGYRGPGGPTRQLQRWRMFFMACAELFAYDRGEQWGVGHYLFQKQSGN